MSALYYELRQQVEAMTVADLAVAADDRINATALRARARLAMALPTVDASGIFGELLYVRNGFIHGWALDGSDLAKKVVVKAVTGGRVVATAIADEPLPPLLSSSMRGPRANAGFVLRAFPGRMGTAATKVDVMLEGSDIPLARDLSIYPPSTALSRTQFAGFAEPNNDGVACGWAWCASEPERSLDIIILINGNAVARARAHHYRGDLLQAGIGNGDHGFSVQLNPRILTDKSRSIEYVIAENGLRLSGSPKTIHGQIIAPQASLTSLGKNSYLKAIAQAKSSLAAMGILKPQI